MDNQAGACILFVFIAILIISLVNLHCSSVTKLERIDKDLEEITKFIFDGNSGRSCGFCKRSPTDLQVVIPEEPNFALESIGASIVHTEDEPPNALNWFLISVGVKYRSNDPDKMLNPSMQVGSCYAFKGDKSTFTIKLSHKIFIRGITLEHISEAVSLTGDISNAPKDFFVYGVENLEKNWDVLLGSFQYDNTKTKRAQTFRTINIDQRFRYCKVKIVSNHGNSQQTCIYRVAVHGKTL